ncbi:MAG: helix-turn-helix transcriptional regulator [Acidobacteria bacterium]|nr:helix-turn-helix transcriptional regulator [Acidobacteriota bacterium]
MDLATKLKHLRSLEGARRGFKREITQTEVSRLMRDETGTSVTQAYLSQIESGTRRHLSDETRERLAHFFRVHPGYLVDDPVGYEPADPRERRRRETSLDEWLVSGAEQFASDPQLAEALIVLSRRKDTRRCVILVSELMKLAPGGESGRAATGRKTRTTSKRRGKRET